MLERIWLGVLYLSGWNISTCLPRQYHYVADPKTWTEAQTYCRKNYTDLATIANTSEMNQLTNTVNSSGNSSDTEVWIGVYDRINWRWSDDYIGSGDGYRNWDNWQPDNYINEQFCVLTGSNGRWWDDSCMIGYPFICNNGTRLDPVFVYVNKEMNWSSAQKYCRENFIDLVTVKSDNETQAIQNLMPSGYAWIGLFRDSHMWSDGSSVSFSNWTRSGTPIKLMSVACGLADMQTGKWKTRSCEKRLPFVCYSVPSPPPVMRRVIKLRIKTGQANVDMNDAAVKADILKKLQDKLKKKGVSGVTLKWREQPDGKVFHKEGKQSKKKYRVKTEL